MVFKADSEVRCGSLHLVWPLINASAINTLQGLGGPNPPLTYAKEDPILSCIEVRTVHKRKLHHVVFGNLQVPPASL